MKMNTTENVAILIRTVRASGATAAELPPPRQRSNINLYFEFQPLMLTIFNIRPSMQPW